MTTINAVIFESELNYEALLRLEGVATVDLVVIVKTLVITS